MATLARILALTFLLALIGPACGGDSTEPTSVPATAEPAQSTASPVPRTATETSALPAVAPAPTMATPQPATTPRSTSAAAPTNTPETATSVPAATAAGEPPTKGAESTPVPENTPVATVTPVPEPAPTEPATEGQSFVVGEGSEITFTVEEELRRSPIRFDAVISSKNLSGTANLDGRPSEITLDLHSLQSDQSFRDRYIRERMFPGTRTATVTVDQLPDLPQSFFDGEETSGSLMGSLRIGDQVTPLTFDVVARHDGSVVNVLAKTTFTWEQLGIATPIAGPVVYLADEVRVQVLIVAREQ